MSYHSDNKFQFTQTLKSDGTCPSDTPPTPPAPANECTQSLSDGGSMEVSYDPDTSMVVMNALIPDGSYAAWGWGASMVDTEMVMFSANGASSNV